MVDFSKHVVIRHLYVHIPFCHHICPYCAFYKHQPGALANRQFVDAVIAEAKLLSKEIEIRPQTIFLGGGTPGFLSSALLERLFTGLRREIDCSQVEEWTFETNPATFGPDKAKKMRSLGVTRLSLGVQSFQPHILSTLGRDHSPGDATEAFQILRETEFPSINIDLIFSVPGQSEPDWNADLDKILSLDPDHVSCYNLTYEEDTDFFERFKKGELDASEDRDAALFYRAVDQLEGAGFHHYEISNYARPGHESIHNQAYWEGADYLGLGPSAVSTIDGTRWKNLPDTAAYINAIGEGRDCKTELEYLSAEDLRLEAIAMQLRTSRGLSIGYSPGPYPLESLIKEGLIVCQDDRIRLTRNGKSVADAVAGALC